MASLDEYVVTLVGRGPIRRFPRSEVYPFVWEPSARYNEAVHSREFGQSRAVVVRILVETTFSDGREKGSFLANFGIEVSKH